ncbi:Protein of unknown function [Cotesia congregata]|uniref:Uncharacterized protein n=1 Tax=Cotesia congregata TaxID=51543 RepID=A0A8J2HEF5_COTCN|nr:Protein of unknown function [Cotesia congregata]
MRPTPVKISHQKEPGQNDFEIKKNDCQLQHLTRYALMKRVDGIFKNSFDDVRKAILDIIKKGGYVCTTADVWTGGSRRFLGVTVSWIHPGSLEHKSAAIACRRFYGTHSFDAIAEQLSDIHSSFRLTAQSIRATVTDNGSNFVKDFKEFGIEALNDTFADKYILRSPKTSESLKSYLGVSLKRPVVTRWNSTYDCINQLLSVQNKLLDNSKINLMNGFKSKDFKFLAEYVRCSKPLACAIDRLQGDKCYYGVLLPTLVSVKYEMQKLINDTTFIDFKPLAQAIIDGINKRFQKLFDPSQPDIDAFLAAIPHPQFKGRWLTPFTDEDQKKIHDRFSEVVSAEASIDSTVGITEDEIDEFNFGEFSSAIPEFQPACKFFSIKLSFTKFFLSLKKYSSIKENI